ncbi:MAG: T9SS type A sorting domain-containing protein [Bacteroidales bacterium]|nr:T9SS type A sorting domain-containing protein [Bacteroidales bacterium]
MQRLFYTLLILLCAVNFSCAQIIECSPEYPNINSQDVTITFHADLGTAGLKGFSGDVYAHTGVILKGGSDSDWKNVVADWDKNVEKCKLTRISTDTYELKIGNIKDFYGLTDDEAADIYKMAFVFRSSDGKKEGKNTGGLNIFYEVYAADEFTLSVKKPSESVIFVDGGEKFTLEVSASTETAEFSYEIDGTAISQNSPSVEITAETSGFHVIKITAKDGSKTAEKTVSYMVREDAVTAEMPQGLRRGVNVTGENEATFVLFAPGKKNAYLIGDFSDWQISGNYAMKLSEDKKYFFCTVSGLDKNKEYAYQYIVDETVRIADPYTEKILDPDNDKFLTKEVYDGNLSYPENKTFGIASTFCLGKKNYAWQVENFDAPEAKDLIIYEMLIRDFTKEGTVKAAKENLDYLETLGVNAIELMPFSEFEGNNSWGYNPSFCFAADKAYGTTDDYKEFIDECHKRGIAVIQDIVLNHAFGSSPFVQLYFDGSNVTEDSPWFNTESPNKVYYWGYDFNHEAAETQALVDSVMSYWLSEYKIDGIRFDFTKGFTNTPATNDAQCSAYDESRIKILERIYDKMHEINPKAYMICEHLTDNSEEKVLANYGILLWGNLNYAFCQSAMGYASGCNLNPLDYTQRGFEKPALISYAESHDEERMMFKCLKYGSTSADYDVKDVNTSLERLKGAAAVLLAMPGPKMIWQFGELGYGYSINYDINTGTENNDARTGRKPYPENYLDDENRKGLYDFYSKMCALRKTNEAMKSGSAKIEASGLIKIIYRRSANANLVFAVNFNTKESSAKIAFPKTGVWYDIVSGKRLEVSDLNVSYNLAAGQTAIFSDSEEDVPTAVSDITPKSNVNFTVYPNPCTEFFNITSDEKIEKISILSSDGKRVKEFSNIDSPTVNISVTDLKSGFYFTVIKIGTKELIKKVIVR